MKKIDNGIINNGGKLPGAGWYLWRVMGDKRWGIFYNRASERRMLDGAEWRGPFDTYLDANRAGGPRSRHCTGKPEVIARKAEQ